MEALSSALVSWSAWSSTAAAKANSRWSRRPFTGIDVTAGSSTDTAATTCPSAAVTGAQALNQSPNSSANSATAWTGSPAMHSSMSSSAMVSSPMWDLSTPSSSASPIST